MLKASRVKFQKALYVISAIYKNSALKDKTFQYKDLRVYYVVD